MGQAGERAGRARAAKEAAAAGAGGPGAGHRPQQGGDVQRVTRSSCRLLGLKGGRRRRRSTGIAVTAAPS